MTQTTPEKCGAAKPWKKGESGNLAGRTPGVRTVLSQAFLKALSEDFAIHGASVIRKVRRYKPEEYLKIIAKIVPQHIQVDDPREKTADQMRDELNSKLSQAIADAGAETLATEPCAGSA